MSALHYMLACPSCRHAIQLPLETLATAFGPEEARTRDSEPVAAVCNYCKQARNYDLAVRRTNPGWVPLVGLDPSSMWRNVGWLRCEDEACELRLPLFAPVNRYISTEERIEAAKAWMWDGLHCPAGHPIQKPQSVFMTPEQT